MSRVQLALNADDLDTAIAFYSALFNTVKPGYANFAVAEPPLKLVLFENPGLGGTLNHLGVEVSSCCFATHDKVWVTGPGGERWGVYTVVGDADTFGPENAAATVPQP